MVEKVKEFYVVELGSSDVNYPDFLRFLNGCVSWLGSNKRSSNPHHQKEITLYQATHFKSEKEAKKLITDIFGKKFNYRITRHFKYE